MIDHRIEIVRTLTDAAAGLPRRRGGKPVNVATLYRWATHGCRGVRLETIQIGGTRCTSQEALQRFFERLTQSDRDPGSAADGTNHRPPTPRRERAAKAFEAKLERSGI